MLFKMILAYIEYFFKKNIGIQFLILKLNMLG